MSDGLRPAVLITDAFNAQYTQSKKRGVREKSLVTTILKTLRGGGNVLLPIDTAGACPPLHTHLASALLTRRLPVREHCVGSPRAVGVEVLVAAAYSDPCA